MSASEATQPIGLQLYSVRELAKLDLIGTLRAIAEIGYPAVEFAGYYDVPARELRAALNQYGLQAAGSHVPYQSFQTELGPALEVLNVLGCTHIAVPWLSPELRPTDRDQAMALATNLNAWGERTLQAGIRLDYHNHDFELVSIGDRTVFDLLVEETDPAYVDFELDLGWIFFAGFDPAAAMERLAGRIPLVHIKDINAGAEMNAVPVGEGVIDWPPLLETARASGAEWFIVEQDNPIDVLAEVRRSYVNLNRLLS